MRPVPSQRVLTRTGRPLNPGWLLGYGVLSEPRSSNHSWRVLVRICNRLARQHKGGPESDQNHELCVNALRDHGTKGVRFRAIPLCMQSAPHARAARAEQQKKAKVGRSAFWPCSWAVLLWKWYGVCAAFIDASCANACAVDGSRACAQDVDSIAVVCRMKLCHALRRTCASPATCSI